MRDDNGVFIGIHICKHWNGISRYAERECCGGRKYTVAYCKCSLRGEVLAESFCCSVCPDRAEDVNKISQK